MRVFWAAPLGYQLHKEEKKNQFQVTQHVTVEGRYKNRYDVTILVNGLPLVQIELKRRGLELKEAFNQINRYQRHSYWASYGLFQYVQMFVISFAPLFVSTFLFMFCLDVIFAFRQRIG